MSLRSEIENAPDVPAKIEVSDESYTDGIRCLAKVFLRELDSRGADWEPPSDSATALGDELFAVTREKIPAALRQELSGGQVMHAAWMAFRAFKGDGEDPQ